MFQLSLDLGIPIPQLEEQLSEADILRYYAFYELKHELEQEQLEAARNGRN